MKLTVWTRITGTALLGVLAMPLQIIAEERHEAEPPPHYVVTDLGTLPGGTFSQADQGITDNGLIGGGAALPDGTQHAVLWDRGRIVDIAQAGLGGAGGAKANSFVYGVNERAQAVGQVETTTPDAENFCLYGTGLQCVPFLWQDGKMIVLPTLGGNNGGVSAINKQGEAVGLAENRASDPNCPLPQIFDFEAVVWDSKHGHVRELRPLPGDSVGFAFWINDRGEAVGTSGSCANTLPNGVVVGPHAVLWEKDGTPIDLGNLGGSVNVSLVAVGNRAIGINNRGQVVGGSTLPGNTTSHAFLWTRETRKMRDLGTLDGDVNTGALSINDSGDVVGVSNDASGGARAFLWRNGVMTDLNTLAPDSPLHLLFAAGINSRGEISGFGATEAGDIHAFLAVPCDQDHAEAECCKDRDGKDGTRGRPSLVLSEYARKLVRQKLEHHYRVGRFE
jgi:probable HAF family extracellular repeat protein